MKGRNFTTMMELKARMPVPDISRLAQIVAFSFFPFGRPSYATLDTLTPAALKGLTELMDAGLITKDGNTYHATEKLPMPAMAWSEPKEDELCVLLT